MIENEKSIRSDIFKYEDRRFCIYIIFFPESERDIEDQIKRSDKKNKTTRKMNYIEKIKDLE